MELTDDEVIQILKYIEESRFNELHLEIGDLKLIVRRGRKGNAGSKKIPSLTRAESTDFKTSTKQIREQEPESKLRKIESEGPITIEEGLITIKASMLGTFYRSPEPGALPYVDVGAFVKEDDTVCLIEVMKVFNALKAGVRGHIEKICAESGQLVEYGQTLFLVRIGKISETKGYEEYYARSDS